MKLNSILRDAGFEPAAVAVILHTPTEPKLRRMLATIAAEEPELFDAYQNNHPRNPEATLMRREYAVSLGHLEKLRLI